MQDPLLGFFFLVFNLEKRLTSSSHVTSHHSFTSKPAMEPPQGPGLPRRLFPSYDRQDISVVVKCRVKADIHVVPNSGGHSCEAIRVGTTAHLWWTSVT
jgi:hypothetical protein